MKNYLILFLSFYSFIVFSQESNSVVVEHTYIGNKNQSIKQVEVEAINHAKIKALSKAGIKEHVKTYASLYKRSDNNDYESTLTSTFFSEKQGAVTSYSIIDKKNTISDEGLPTCHVIINATVIKYENDADYNYKAIIDGLEPVYSYDNEKILHKKNPVDGCAVKFNFTPTKDTYLTIFALWNNNVYIIFPNEFANRNKNTIFKKDKVYKFGDQPKYWFNSEKKSTAYRLVIVMHKEERTFDY